MARPGSKPYPGGVTSIIVTPAVSDTPGGDFHPAIKERTTKAAEAGTLGTLSFLIADAKVLSQS